MKSVVLSGMRPTGSLHLGHLHGVISKWKELQETAQCFFMIADWHALMSEYQTPEVVSNAIYDNLADWIACGISPEKSCFFIQSDVPEHLELALILGYLTSLPRLQRCPTFKESQEELSHKSISTYAFFGYPVLQAADILLYRATHVPIGEDQLPHLELTRELARKFNHTYQSEILIEPKPLLTPQAKILGCDRRKMSKSYGNSIAISEPEESLKSRVMGMVTDTQRTQLSIPGRPDECNVFSFHKLYSPDLSDTISKKCSTAQIGCFECKKILHERLSKSLQPIRERKQELLNDVDTLKDILSEGARKARETARATLDLVRSIVYGDRL